MNTKPVFSAFLFLWALSGRAQEFPSRFDASTNPTTAHEWNTSPAYWDRLISESRESSGLRIGRSDFVVRGPLVEGFRRQRFAADRSNGQKFLGWPIVRLFVPQRMAPPPGGSGKYFAWGERDRPWSAASAGAPPGGAFSPIHNDPVSGLISVNW
jgi:hypothetical protein